MKIIVKSTITLLIAAAVFPDLFDIDIGGKYWARRGQACGKGCTACMHPDKDGCVPSCRYVFCRDVQGVSADGSPNLTTVVLSSPIIKFYPEKVKGNAFKRKRR